MGHWITKVDETPEQGLSRTLNDKLQEVIGVLSIPPAPPPLNFLRRVLHVTPDAGEEAISDSCPLLEVSEPLDPVVVKALRKAAASNRPSPSQQEVIRAEDERLVEILTRRLLEMMNYQICYSLCEDDMQPIQRAVCAVPFDRRESATPFDDMRAILNMGAREFAYVYDVITMATEDLMLIARTNQFIRFYRLSPYAKVPDPEKLPVEKLCSFIGTILGATVRLNDDEWELPHGRRDRVLPVGELLFSNAGDETNQRAMDYYTALLPSDICAKVGMKKRGVGPVAYYKEAPNEMPPGIELCIAHAGRLRKHITGMTATLRVRA